MCAFFLAVFHPALAFSGFVLIFVPELGSVLFSAFFRACSLAFLFLVVLSLAICRAVVIIILSSFSGLVLRLFSH